MNYVSNNINQFSEEDLQTLLNSSNSTTDLNHSQSQHSLPQQENTTIILTPEHLEASPVEELKSNPSIDTEDMQNQTTTETKTKIKKK